MSQGTGLPTHVHIGIEKTGTTTIQHFLGRNRQLLLRRGLLFPEAPGRPNHLKLAAYAQSDDQMDDTRRRFVSGPDDLPEFRRRLREWLSKEVAAGGELRKVVLSNEHLSARLTSAADVERLADLIDQCFGGPVHVVVYLREQVANFRSSYSTNLRHTRTTPPLTSISGMDLAKYDYDQRLAPWEEVFGQDNVTVRLFEPAGFKDGDLLRDFLDAIDEPWPERAEVPERQNEQLDAASLEFLRVFNTVAPELLRGEALGDARWRLVQALEKSSDGPGLEVDPGLAEELRAHCAASNTAIARRHFGRDQLFTATPTSTGTPWSKATQQQLMEVFIRLWDQLRDESD